MRGPEKESQKGSRETNTVSTEVLMEAPRSGRDAPRGFPELDLGEVGRYGTLGVDREQPGGNSKLGLAETGGSEGDSRSDWGNGGILSSWNVRALGGYLPPNPGRLGIS